MRTLLEAAQRQLSWTKGKLTEARSSPTEILRSLWLIYHLLCPLKEHVYFPRSFFFMVEYKMIMINMNSQQTLLTIFGKLYTTYEPINISDTMCLLDCIA